MSVSNCTLERSVIAKFHELVEPIFRSLDERADKPYRRKPPHSLRLRIDDRHRLTVNPHWMSHAKTLNTSRFKCEFLESTFYEKYQKWQTVRVLTFVTTCDGATLTRWYRQRVEQDQHTVNLLLAEFVADPQKVLARDSDHCAICGRTLTDGTSRGRGIGPECVRSLPWLGFDSNLLAR